MKTEIIHERKDFNSVHELIEWAGETYGDKAAYSFRRKPSDKEIEKISFLRFRSDVRALASKMLSMGCAGKHCTIIGRFSYEWVTVYYAALSIGAVLVPLDRDWKAEDLLDTARKAEAAFLFVDEDIADKGQMIAEELNISENLYYLNAKDHENNVMMLTVKGSMLYAKDPDAYKNAPVDPDTLSLLVFTSGTTGKGKGVMLTQTAILYDISAALPYIDYADKTVGVLPPHHTYCSTIMFIAHAMIGCEIYISAGLRYITKELKEQKPGHLVLVPLYLETFYRKILSSVREQGKETALMRLISVSNGLRKLGIDRRKQFFSAVREAFGGELRMVISGGAPINSEILEFFDSIGISTLNGYGITECAPLIAVNHSRHIVEGSVGNVIDIDTVKIDEPNEEGEGEILVKGPNVMLGYYGDPEATADAFDEEGYFRTGDYGTLTKDGILSITGRKKNLIILSNGKNVYPEEIENELIAAPGILEIVVYEGKSKRGMEHNAIVAEVFPDNDYLEKNNITDVREYLKTFINDYNKTAVPYKKITVLKLRKEEFPKNTLRKIMRFKLDMTIE